MTGMFLYIMNVFVSSILLLVLIYGKKIEYAKTQKYFNCYIFIMIVHSLLTCVTTFLYEHTNPASPSWILYFIISLQYICQFFEAMFFYFYMTSLILENTNSERAKIVRNYLKYFSYVIYFMGIYVVVLLLQNCINKNIFSLEGGSYNRGPFFSLYHGIYSIFDFLIVINLIICIFDKQIKKENKKTIIVFFIFNLFVITGSILSYKFYFDIFALAFNTISLLGIFLHIQLSQMNLSKNNQKKNLVAVTFGNFQLTYRGEEVKFKRSKSRELIAFLIDRKGTPVTMNEISAYLWSRDFRNDKKNSNIRVLIYDIKQTLNALEIHNFFIKGYNTCSINPEMISCDYYDFLNGSETARRQFTGKYMAEFSWAEETCEFLNKILK